MGAACGWDRIRHRCLRGLRVTWIWSPWASCRTRVTRCCLRQVEALQEVLERLGSRELPAVEKRLSWVPWCEPGEPCAVRKGARIGKLCSCPHGTVCNSFILKCS
ncbi:cocaine- and amphetamine-regulated transcript protein-like [Ciconia boyciana]|uniref:cocaine- and amphetamine-regulated transcript protein-like n=1 Tax=Ciconia boyciana TaxID=52775 RepID=UPI003BA27F29